MENLVVSAVSVKPSFEGGKNRLRGYASIELNQSLRVVNLRIIEGRPDKDGRTTLYVAYPSREKTIKCPSFNGKTSPKNKFCPNCGVQQVIDFTKVSYKEMVYPITKELDQQINDCVLDQLKRILDAEDQK